MQATKKERPFKDEPFLSGNEGAGLCAWGAGGLVYDSLRAASSGLILDLTRHNEVRSSGLGGVVERVARRRTVWLRREDVDRLGVTVTSQRPD